MTLTPRQWIVVLLLIAGFAIAAVVVSRDDGGTPQIDTAAWCAAASDLEGTGSLFDGTAANATDADYETAKEALFGVEVLAPFSLRLGIARLADFSLIAGQQLATHPWPDAWASARDMVDTTIVDTAIADLEMEMSTCGLRLSP